MENTFYVALENIKHNGTDYLKGTVIDSAFGEFEGLVLDGVLKVVEGAKTLEHAVEMVTKEAEAAIVAAEEPVIVPAQNTWGPKADPITAPVDTVGAAGTDVNVPQDLTAPVGTTEPATSTVPTGDNL